MSWNRAVGKYDGDTLTLDTMLSAMRASKKYSERPVFIVPRWYFTQVRNGMRAMKNDKDARRYLIRALRLETRGMRWIVSEKMEVE